jgi:predicted  nucleic acid-binding Zn ribbon protein
MRLAGLLLVLTACAQASSGAQAQPVDAGPDVKTCDQLAREMCQLCREQALDEVQMRQLDIENAALLEQKASLEADIADKCARLKARGGTSPICRDGGIRP